MKTTPSLKPYLLVAVAKPIDMYLHHHFIGQTMGFPLPNNQIMIRTVPGHPGTLIEINRAFLTVLPDQKLRRWVHYARVVALGPYITSFPTGMLYREHAMPVTFNPDTGERTEEQDLIAKVSENRSPYWNLDRWRSFSRTLEHVLTERAMGNMS